MRFRFDSQEVEDSSPDQPPLPDVSEPQEAGTKLLMGGEFGRIGPRLKAREDPFDLPKVLLYRTRYLSKASYKEDIASVRILNFV